MIKEEFDFLEEPEIIMVECNDCGVTSDTDDHQCKYCESEDVMVFTNIEGQDCILCGSTFDIWDNFHRLIDGDFECICTNCYDNLESEEDMEEF